MPKYKTHLFIGFITYLIMILALKLNIFGKSHTFLYLAACLLGSLFPDIDTKSMIQKILYFVLFLVMGIAIFAQNWQIAAILGVVSLIPIISNHRGITHRIWFIIVVPLVIPIVIFHYNPQLIYPAFISYLFFVSGAMSHIFSDKFTSWIRRKK